MAVRAKAYLKERFFKTDNGLIIPLFRDMQTPALFALKLGLVEGAAKEKTVPGETAAKTYGAGDHRIER